MARDFVWMVMAVLVVVAAAITWQHYGPQPPHQSLPVTAHSDWAELRRTLPPARYP